jgi:hypothetical protein
LIGLVTEAKIPFDFVVNDQARISLVRVRRLKYSQYGISDILRSCGQEIKELRELRIPDGIYRELWVRGPYRAWHMYLVLPDTIEVHDDDEDDDEHVGDVLHPSQSICNS